MTYDHSLKLITHINRSALTGENEPNVETSKRSLEFNTPRADDLADALSAAITAVSKTVPLEQRAEWRDRLLTRVTATIMEQIRPDRDLDQFGPVDESAIISKVHVHQALDGAQYRFEPLRPGKAALHVSELIDGTFFTVANRFLSLTVDEAKRLRDPETGKLILSGDQP